MRLPFRVVSSEAPGPLPPASDWSETDFAECLRCAEVLRRHGIPVAIERGLTDEFEPWLVFVAAEREEPLLHAARLDGRVVVVCPPLGISLKGFTLREALRRLFEDERFTRAMAPVRVLGGEVHLHPAAALFALVAAAFLLAAKEAEAAEGGAPMPSWLAETPAAPAPPAPPAAPSGPVAVEAESRRRFGGAATEAALLAGAALLAMAGPDLTRASPPAAAVVAGAAEAERSEGAAPAFALAAPEVEWVGSRPRSHGAETEMARGAGDGAEALPEAPGEREGVVAAARSPAAGADGADGADGEKRGGAGASPPAPLEIGTLASAGAAEALAAVVERLVGGMGDGAAPVPAPRFAAAAEPLLDPALSRLLDAMLREALSVPAAAGAPSAGPEAADGEAEAARLPGPAAGPLRIDFRSGPDSPGLAEELRGFVGWLADPRHEVALTEREAAWVPLLIEACFPKAGVTRLLVVDDGPATMMPHRLTHDIGLVSQDFVFLDGAPAAPQVQVELVGVGSLGPLAVIGWVAG